MRSWLPEGSPAEQVLWREVAGLNGATVKRKWATPERLLKRLGLRTVPAVPASLHFLIGTWMRYSSSPESQESPVEGILPPPAEVGYDLVRDLPLTIAVLSRGRSPALAQRPAVFESGDSGQGGCCAGTGAGRSLLLVRPRWPDGTNLQVPSSGSMREIGVRVGRAEGARVGVPAHGRRIGRDCDDGSEGIAGGDDPVDPVAATGVFDDQVRRA